MSTTPEKNLDALAVYEQLCQNYRAIDDFRTKLLALLPFATAAGVLVLLKDQIDTNHHHHLHTAQLFLGAIGSFGFLVTLGLFSYELHGMKKCGTLIHLGSEIETFDLRIADGPFSTRPPRLAGFIDEPFAASVIYPATLAAWVFLALALASDVAALSSAIAVFVVTLGLSQVVIRVMEARLKKESKRRRKKRRKEARRKQAEAGAAGSA